jgi:hypothetical protein
MANCKNCGNELPEGHHGLCKDCMKERYKTPEKDLRVEVKVDNEQLKMALENQKELERKLAEAEEGKKLFEEIKSRVETQYMNEGLRIPNIVDRESLNDAVKNMNEIERLKEQKKQNYIDEGAGTLPLSQAQVNGDVREGFESVEAMIDHLHDMKKVGTPKQSEVANEVLNKMTYKFVNQLRKENRPIFYEDKNFEILKKITENKRRRELLKNPNRPQERD